MSALEREDVHDPTPELSIVRGRDMPEQMFIGRKPRKRYFQTPMMESSGMTFRDINQPINGLWTSSILPDGTSSVVVWHLNQNLAWETLFSGSKWWKLVPRGTARIIRIDTEDDYQAALSRYRFKQSDELDFVAILEDGIDAVHLTKNGVKTVRMFGSWAHESCVWLSWVFVDVIAVEIPPEIQELQKDGKSNKRVHTSQQGQANRRRAKWIRLDGEFKGFRFRARQMKAKELKRMRRIIAERDQGVESTLESDFAYRGDTVRIELIKHVVESMITDHNLTDQYGDPLPVGEGLFEGLLNEDAIPDLGIKVISELQVLVH